MNSINRITSHWNIRLFALLLLLGSGINTVCLGGDPAVPALPAQDYPWMSIATWRGIHESFIKKGKESKIDLLFIGDSITEQWTRDQNKPVWEKFYGSHNPADFGIGGDLTENVLWRITNGEIDGIKPKVVVLLIGTNNTGPNSSEEIAKGITAIVKTLRTKLPATKILLLGILPRGAEPKTQLREKITAVNDAIKKLDDGKMVRYLDIGPKLLDNTGILQPDVAPDALHLSQKGYQIWAETMDPSLKQMLGNGH